MNYPKHVLEANDILRDLDGVYPGYTPPDGKFQLRHSSELKSLVPAYEEKLDALTGEWTVEPIYDVVCGCGVNKRVHTRACLRKHLFASRMRLQTVSTFGPGGQFQSFNDVYAFCNWQPPSSREQWKHTMGSDADYPTNGRYLPIHRGSLPIVIPPKASPEEFSTIARLLVKKMTEHAFSWKTEMMAETAKSQKLQVPIYDQFGNVVREPDKSARYWDIKARLAEKMRVRNPTGTIGYSKKAEAFYSSPRIHVGI